MSILDHRLTTARLYWQPSYDANGYIDFGNAVDYKYDPTRERVPHLESKKGYRQVDFEDVKLVAEKRTFTFDEHFNETLRVLALAKPFTEVVQGSMVAASFTIIAVNLVLGRSYHLGKIGTKNLTGLASGSLTLGVDFTWDKGGGFVTPISTANFGSDWVFTFDCDDVTQLSFTALGRLLEQGTFKMLEFDQHDETPINTEQFGGQVQVTGWGEHNGEFNKFTVEVLHTV
jgi:hypothetical protein